MRTVTPSVDLSIHLRKSRLSIEILVEQNVTFTWGKLFATFQKLKCGISLQQRSKYIRRQEVSWCDGVHCSEMPKRFVFDASHVTFCKLNWLFLLLTLDWLPVPLVCRLRLLELLSPSVIQWLLYLRWRGVQQVPLSMRPWVCQETQKLLRSSNCLPIVLN